MAGAVETVTIGAVNYSVYGLGNADPVGDADDYFAARLGATSWTGATATAKAQALVTAVRMLDRRATWTGTKTSAVQPLQWPRDSATRCGEAVADGTIPDEIVLGEFELALALLEDEAVQDSQGTGSNLKRVKAGSAEVEYFVPTIGSEQDLQFPRTVQELVGCYLDSSAVLGGPYVDGTDVSSSFDSDDEYGLARGL